MTNDIANSESVETKIYGRKSFFEKARKMIASHEMGYYIISCINIDNFKVINAQYGAFTGDCVLRHVAQCICECMESIGGICGHIAGDDFAALYPAENVNFQTLKNSYMRASAPEDILQKIRLRVGRYLIDNGYETVDSMYDNAKIAANSIRENYEKDIEYYRDYMRAEIVKKQQIIYEMNDALSKSQFEIWIQPQYNHATGAIIGGEVLSRWNREGKYISPADFIPIFEQSGFIYELDKFVWEKTCELLKKWIDEERDFLPLSVNISRRDILHDDFIDVFTGIINKYDISFEYIRVEVTESAFSDSTDEVIEKVTELIDLGFIVEIDDFGSGYSSLNTLKDVPADVLKLDMKFFESSKNSQRAGNIIESVVRMAKWLGMAVIAEGVEDKAQADYLKSIGCYYIQGFYYAKPMKTDEYENRMFEDDGEFELSRLKTLEKLDNNEFWNPHSMDTLIFNSYVGGACIFEYYKEKTNILRVNDEYIRQFGGIVSPDTELHGISVSKYMDDNGKRLFFESIDSAIKIGGEPTFETTISNGIQTEYIRVTLKIIARTDDRYLFYSVISNITHQRLAEINERNMATQLDTIMKGIHAGVTATVFDSRENFDVIFINNGFYKIYGYTKEQYENEVKNINDLIYTKDYEYAMVHVENVMKSGKTEVYEFRAIKRDGSIIWIQMTNSVVSLDGIGDNVLIGISMDVTDFHNAKETEAEAADKLRAVLKNVGNGITAAYPDGGKIKFVIINDKFYEIFGLSKKAGISLTPKDMLNLTYADDREYVERETREAIYGGKGKVIEYRIVKPDGSIAWIKASISTADISGIDVPVQISVFSDITSAKEYVTELTLLNDTAHDILSQPDYNAAIRQTLRRILGYFNGTRAYVFEFNDDKTLFSNTFEICSEKGKSIKEKLQNIPVGILSDWMERVKENQYVIVDYADKMSERQSEIRKILNKHNVKAVIISPLLRDGKLFGFVGVDNPKWITNNLNYLRAIGDYIAAILTRRDLTEKINFEERRFLEYSSDIPGGFVSLKKNHDGVYVPEYISMGIKKLLSMNDDEIDRTYGKNILGGVHPDDVETARKSALTMVETRETVNDRYRVKNGQGKYIWVMFSGRATVDESNNVHLGLYYTDITNEIEKNNKH